MEDSAMHSMVCLRILLDWTGVDRIFTALAELSPGRVEQNQSGGKISHSGR